MRIFKICIIVLILQSYAAAAEWKEYKCRHFIIYYKKAPYDLVNSVEDMAEYYYDEISDNLGFTRYRGWNWDERAKIYIYDDQEDYIRSAEAAKWSHGIASVREKVIRTFPMAHGFFDSTLPHELGHIIFREFIGFSADIPLWFEEGVAMYQEKAKRWGAHDDVRRAIEDGSFKGLEELALSRLGNSADQKDVLLFYAESASIINYLINEQGKERFKSFCLKLKAGSTFDVALAIVYVRFKNINDLNKTWISFLKDG